MKRRNFFVNILLWILAFFFGYTFKRESENKDLKIIFVSVKDYDFVGDYSAATNSGIDNLTAFVNLINDNPRGARVYVPEGNYYISDENLLPSIIEQFEFIGIGSAVFTFGKVCGDNTNIIPISSSVPNWKDCEFENITFSAPFAKGYAIFTRGSKNIKFYHCTVSDVKPHFLQGTESGVIFNNVKFIAPNTPKGSCLQTIGNVPQHFIVEYCEWNFAPNGGAGSLISATNDDRLIGDYWFERNKFFTDNLEGYYIDAAIDLEPNNSSRALRNVYINENIFFNGRVYLGSFDNLWFTKNTMHFSMGPNGGVGVAAIEGFNSYNTPPCGVAIIEGNVIVCEDASTDNYKQPIHFHLANKIEQLTIRGNRLIANGKMINDENFIINIGVKEGSIELLEIKDNVLGYTSVPTSLFPAIFIITFGNITFKRVFIDNNKLIGEQGACSFFIGETTGTTPSKIDLLRVIDNDVTKGLPANGFINISSPNVITNFVNRDNIGAG